MSESNGLDVIVIGAGAAGIAAARAASVAGARVAMVSDGDGATGLTAGWIAAGATGGLDRDALAWLPEVSLRPLGAYAFATIAGAVASAVSGLASLLDLSDLPDGTLGVVDLVAGTAWSAALVAESVGPIAARDVRVVIPGAGAPRAASTLEVAHALDTPGMVDALAESLRQSARGCAALLFPPVLGFARDDVATRLAKSLACVLGESGGTAYDPTACRLVRAIDRGVPAGVQRVQARATVSCSAGRLMAHAGNAGDTLRARAIVLATGGLVAGGLLFDADLVEPCAGTPVWRDGAGPNAVLVTRSSDRGLDPWPLFAPDADGRAAVMRAGVRVGGDLQVLAADGARAFAPGLFAAGDLVAGGGAMYGGSLAGALTAGHRAGLAAAQFAATT